MRTGKTDAPPLAAAYHDDILIFHLRNSPTDLVDRHSASHGRIQPFSPAAAVEPSTAPRPQVRVLTTPMALYTSSTVDTAPGSPPDLTNSLSSKKSSSYNSSSLSEDGPNELANFEDINLDDLPGAKQNDVFAKVNVYTVRPDTRRSGPETGARCFGRSKTVPQPSLRVLTDVNKRDVTAVKPRDPPKSGRPVHFGPQSPRKRVLSSPNPLLPSPMPPGNRSRSPSPTSPVSTPPQSLYSEPSPRRLSATGNAPLRRLSWQPGRKTVQELEDEYHDSDEEIPEDAVVWNIPLSPRPPGERNRSCSPSKSDLAAEPSMDGSLSLHRASSDTAVTATEPGAGLDATPKPRALSRSMSVNVPPDANVPRPPIKSWNAAMSDLSAEARLLTAALEAFASERDKAHEDAVQAGAGSRLSSSSFSSFRLGDSKRLSSAPTVDLPPLRRGDIMIDPLPVSKEKEAVLTRTRPSWLPPKDRREEKRHLKEYARMMAGAREAERRKQEKSRREQARRDRDQGSLNRIWEQHVLPNWERCMREPRTKDLWWRGVSQRSRGEVWRRAVGNELGLTEASYLAALERARAAEERLMKMSEEHRETEKEWRWFEEIRRDVRTAFPELTIFQPDGGPLHDAFVELLMAYSMYRSDVGYVSSINVSQYSFKFPVFQYIRFSFPRRTVLFCTCSILEQKTDSINSSSPPSSSSISPPPNPS